MKCSALIAMLLATFIISCTALPTSTPIPQLTVVTRIVTPTPQIVVVTATPEPTNAPTVMPTNTPTSMPTRTVTPTPTPLPPLYVQGTDFYSDGKPVILRGAVTNHFLLQQMLDKPSQYVAIFQKDIDTLKEMGANFVIVDWNSGYLDEPGYIERLTQGLEYAKSKGLRVELTLHSRGRKPGSTWDSVQISIADDQIVADWKTLLNDPAIAARIGESVDIFGPLSEPKWTARGVVRGEIMKWSELKPIYINTMNLIRDKIGKPKAVGAFSPPNRAGDARDIVNDPPGIENIAIEMHPYRWIATEADFKNTALALKNRGMLVFAGEFGCQFGDDPDPLEYTEDLVKFFVANQMSYAFYAMISDTTNAGCTLQIGRSFTPLGNLALRYWPNSLPTPVPTPLLMVDEKNSLVIYDDLPGSGWTDRSWDATIDLAFREIKFSGEKAIKVSPKIAPNTWGALSFRHVRGIDTSPYGWLEFYVNGGNEVPRQLQTFFFGASMVRLSPTVKLSPLVIEGGKWLPNQWHRVRIPLHEMGASKTTILAVAIQDATGSGQSPFYIDQIRLIGATTR